MMLLSLFIENSQGKGVIVPVAHPHPQINRVAPPQS